MHHHQCRNRHALHFIATASLTAVSLDQAGLADAPGSDWGLTLGLLLSPTWEAQGFVDSAHPFKTCLSPAVASCTPAMPVPGTPIGGERRTPSTGQDAEGDGGQERDTLEDLLEATCWAETPEHMGEGGCGLRPQQTQAKQIREDFGAGAGRKAEYLQVAERRRVRQTGLETLRTREWDRAA